MSMVEAETVTQAAVFAALGDPVRLNLLSRLDQGRPQSITVMTEGTGLTRQAVAKHLKVLERAGVVSPSKAGREQHYAVQVRALVAAEAYLQQVTGKWDQALTRLRAHLER
ncbi:MAG: metalloregulator ArsR/SmtB family transcription factor [bacterium]